MKPNNLYHLFFVCSFFIVVFQFLAISCFAQPVNDNCNNALLIPIGNNGYATGIFTSDTIDISAATMQSGETVPPAIFMAGQYQKSIWYKFTTSTRRKLRVTLYQPGINITSGNVGFSVYKTNTCLPGNAQISNMLTPLETFGSTYHPCVDSGAYLIQVSSKINANGPVFLKLEIDPTLPVYDEMAQAYSFGVMNQARKQVTYDMECYSKESIFETCTGTLPDANQYTKTSWHTFTTPGYFDYLTFLVAAGNTNYFTNVSTQHIIGYKLYEGNAQTTPLSALTLVDGCDTIRSNGFRPGYKTYRCGQLDTAKTYSLQLFFKNDFNASIRVGLFREGVAKAKGPLAAASWIQPDNHIGNIPYGITNRVDYFACDSRHLTNSCGNTKLQNGILKAGTRYNLSNYFTFTLAQPSDVKITTTDPPGATFCKNRYIRVFSSGVSNNCSTLDTTSIYKEYFGDTIMRCLPAGDYTIQVMGSEDLLPSLNQNDVITTTTSACLYTNFGQQFNLSVEVIQVLAGNNYSLYQAGAFNALNNMLPLLPGNTYNATVDTFGCHNAARPSNFNCNQVYKKAMYREFSVADSVAVSFGNLSPSFFANNANHFYMYQFFRGNANTLATAQNTWGYPATFTGLTPYSGCFSITFSNNYTCLVPDTYTLATFGTEHFMNKTDQPSVTVANFITQHYSQATVENMGSVLDTINNPLGGSVSSGTDYFSCRENAITIAGVAPCFGATKAIYRQFYLNQPSLVQIIVTSGTMALFSGQLSVVGFNGLTNVAPCGSSYTPFICSNTTLAAGWYTVVSYGSGSSYANPLQPGNQVGAPNAVQIIVSPPCPLPKYNRPYKAAVTPVTNVPILVQWNAAAASNAYPITAVTVTLPTESWNCAPDTPFSSHPIPGCHASNTKVAYYVFSLTQESYLSFSVTTGQYMKLYKRDIRVDSLLFDTLSPIHPCAQNGLAFMEVCNAQPGVYTLAVFGNAQCTSVTPQIYIDRADKSRFDHAKNAYDFGQVPATNTYHNGKTGDVNPLNAGRAPSNDFFYCSTGARTTDPVQSACAVTYNAAIYNQPDSNNVITMPGISRRNLWYTFQLNKPGVVKVKVDNKTTNKNFQYPFAVYKSDVNGSTPFTQVVSNNLVDSTMAQGLTLVTTNGPYVLCNGTNFISFNVPACNFDTTRYYVVVDNRNPYVQASTMQPNHQVEVSIAIDSVPPASTNHDFYVNAFDMDTIGVGTHTGATDYYTCATANTSYPTLMPVCAQRTLWYKFTVDTSVVGTAKIRLKINGTTNAFNADDFLLFREVVQNDSTATGLIKTKLSPIPGYQQACVDYGTYYLVLTGCNKTTESVYPEILIDQNVGDYCSAPLIASISGPGTASATTSIDCHTIGTDYGEFGTTLSCPVNGLTGDYKSSWFRIDVTGTDTLDLTLFISENTNATSSQIHYRMMTGTCNAMQEQSCVLDAATQNTYQCMVPGNSYYLQVFTRKNYFNNNPEYPTLGTITLNVSAVEHVDTCAPMINCLVNANYIPSFDCNVNDSVLFNNFSTFGSSIEYLWTFGYNNETSTSFSPAFLYPSLNTAATYTVTLRAVNTACLDTSYSIQTITIPPRPVVNLGNDTATCSPAAAITLHATSYPGSSYLWQNNSTDSLFIANIPGQHTYYVAVTYGNCTVHDTISIYLSPLIAQPLDTILICDNQTSVTLDATRPFTGTSYVWFDNTTAATKVISSPGVYWADITLQGCMVRDSFAVQYNLDTLSVLGNDTAICNFASGYILNAQLPNATAYLWQNNSILPQISINNPGTYWVRVTLNGCAYTDTVKITSLPLVEFDVQDTICYGGYYVLPAGDTAYSSGLYQDTLAVANGCDSVVNTYLQVRDSIFAIAYDTLCSNQFPLVWNGINVYNGGTNAATFISPAVNGCDSTTSLNLFVYATDSTILNETVCFYTLPYNFLGNDLNASGTYFDTLPNIQGCDSFLVLHLNVLLEFRDTTTQQICLGDSMVFYDSVYYNSGFYTHNFASASGCDSLKILNLLVHPFSPLPLVNSPVVYCQGDAAVPLTATGSSLLWYSSATGGTGSSTAPIPNTSILGQQTYYVSQTINNCESQRDSIIVWVNEPPLADFTLQPDGTICSTDSALATFTGYQPAGSSQVWNWDGGTATGTEPGPYYVRWNTAGLKTVSLWISNAGCNSDTVRKNINIRQAPETPAMELPDYVCAFDTITIYANNTNNFNLNWNYDGIAITEGNSFNRSWPEAGMHYFSLYLTGNDCSSATVTDSIEVIGLPQATIELEDKRICLGETIRLVAGNADNSAIYKWSPGVYFPEGFTDEGQEVNAVVTLPGWIYLNVTDRYDCGNADSVFVQTEHCCDVFLPNAFSPNGDGLNDIFIVQTESKQQIKEFAIFNRFGQKVFISHDQNYGWDGLFKGQPADMGVYNFYIKYICSDGNTYYKKGDLHLMR